MTISTPEAPFTLSPRLGHLLTQVAETSNLEAALWKVLADYIALKRQALQDEIEQFEAKWHMSFVEFAEKFGDGSLPVDAYDYAVESDFWAWEKAETLLEHYQTLLV